MHRELPNPSLLREHGAIDARAGKPPLTRNPYYCQGYELAGGVLPPPFKPKPDTRRANHLNPTPAALDEDEALIRRVLLQGEFNAFMARTPLTYLHRIIAAARKEGFEAGYDLALREN